MTKKVAIITGGTSGLGLAMARKFKQENYCVVVVARNKNIDFEFDEFFSCDLSDVEQRKNLILRLRESYSAIDVFINNAGIGSYATNQELNLADLKRLFEIDYFAPVDFDRELLENIKAANGTIVNISSVAGLMPVACMGAYSSSKSALFMHSETLRMEVKKEQVKVLTVLPGRINTGFSKRAIRIREVPETPSNSSDSAKILAEKVFKAVKNGRERLVYPSWYHIVIWFARHFPTLYRYGNKKAWKLD